MEENDETMQQVVRACRDSDETNRIVVICGSVNVNGLAKKERDETRCTYKNVSGLVEFW